MLISAPAVSRRLIRPDGVGRTLPSISFGGGYGSSGYVDFSNHPGLGDTAGTPWSIVALCYHVYTVDSYMFRRYGTTTGGFLWGLNGNRRLAHSNTSISIESSTLPGRENVWAMYGMGSLGSSGIWGAVDQNMLRKDDGSWGPYPWNSDWRAQSMTGTKNQFVGSYSAGAYQMNGAIAALWWWKGELNPDDWGNIVAGGNPETRQVKNLAFSWLAPADVSANLFTYDRVTGIAGTKAGGSSMSRGPSVNFPLRYRQERSVYYINRAQSVIRVVR